MIDRYIFYKVKHGCEWIKFQLSGTSNVFIARLIIFQLNQQNVECTSLSISTQNIKIYI